MVNLQRYLICVMTLVGKKRKNYTLGHGLERIEIYEKEELNFRIHPVPMLQDKTS